MIRGNVETGRSFAAYYFKKERFIAVDAVNAPRDFMFGKMILTKGQELDRTKIADQTIDLKVCILPM